MNNNDARLVLFVQRWSNFGLTVSKIIILIFETAMASQQAPYITRHSDARRNGKAEGNVLFKWVSLKELIIMFVACCVVAMLMRTKDNVDFNIVLKDSINTNKYRNAKFPTRGEKL